MRSCSRTVARIVAPLLVFAASAPTVLAQGRPTPAPRPGDTLGWYVVRPGDTLESITERFLGTPILWRENWRLNPWLKDPHLLHAGDRLRIIVARKLPPRSAELERVSRRVEEKPHPNPWIPAREGDLLRENDGCRTYRRSSARLRFDDGTRLTLTGESLVFLKRVERTLTGKDRDTVEVVHGQADLRIQPRRAGSLEVEVVAGPAVARPRPGANGRATTRLRRQGESGARMMVYEGESTVEADGAAVEVPAGMGTAVPENGPPKPPEKLLPAPALQSPPRGASLEWSNPVLTWAPVPGTVSYTVEVFRDREAARLVFRSAGLSATSLRTDPLPEGELFWRVTAVSASGLDGYPSRSRPFTVTRPDPDLEPPVVVLAAGPGAAPDGGKGFEAVNGASILLAAMDDVSGVATIRYRWDGGSWRRWTGDPLTVPSAKARHLLEVEAVDRSGRKGGPWRAVVHGRRGRPGPPEVHGGVMPGKGAEDG